MPPLVFLVEDNVDDERLTVRSLRQHSPPPEVVVAQDGERALEMVMEWARDPSQLPNLILLDLKLPKASGFEVLQGIRGTEATRDIPVVILTSSDEPADTEMAWSLGANDYLKKPMDYEGYKAAVLSVARLWLPAFAAQQR
jgi:two-component system response regulator